MKNALLSCCYNCAVSNMRIYDTFVERPAFYYCISTAKWWWRMEHNVRARYVTNKRPFVWICCQFQLIRIMPTAALSLERYQICLIRSLLHRPKKVATNIAENLVPRSINWLKSVYLCHAMWLHSIIQFHNAQVFEALFLRRPHLLCAPCTEHSWVEKQLNYACKLDSPLYASVCFVNVLETIWSFSVLRFACGMAAFRGSVGLNVSCIRICFVYISCLTRNWFRLLFRSV